MASNSELFETAMTRYREGQLYNIFLKVFEIPPLGRFDTNMMKALNF
jgi:hypothetical protein